MNKTNLAIFTLLIAILAAVITIGITPVAFATPTINTVNGHYYEYISSYGITWTAAKEAAENSTYKGLTGHLVTITSESENDFVSYLVSDNYDFTWIGLSDETTEGTYQWVTGEPFAYTNWDTDQPDNYNDNEDYVQFRGYSDKWNDIKNDHHYVKGYIIEYTPPPVKNPANGHYYEYIDYPGITWTAAKTAAELRTHNGTSGHLVTITSVGENAFVADLVPDDARTWIGFSDEDVNHSYRWVTGELYYYTNWDSGQPSSDTNDDDYVEFRGSNNKWNDTVNNDTNITGYVVEYDIPKLNPENGHYYEHVINGAISWTDAKTAAETHTYNGVAGHLVTITSASENQFVKDLLPNNFSAWMGLTDENTEGTYEWVTGETFDYSNWNVNQPDNARGDEHYVDFLSNGKWNDSGVNSSTNVGYIIEYTPPGSIAFLNPANGNYYEYVTDDDITWTAAKTAAENSTYNGIVGHLVTITTASENTFVDGLVPDASHSWIGLSDEITEGTYEWVTGEPYSYSNWNTTQPVDVNNSDYVKFLSSNGKWNNATNNDTGITGYVIEYEITANDPVPNSANRNYYKLVIDPGISWTDAKTAAESSMFNGVNGKLVTITTASENTFVDNLIGNHNFKLWIGLSDETTEGTYTWVTGETFDYSNWDTAQPSAGTDEDYVKFLSSNGKWNNATNNDTGITGYVIEYAINLPPVRNPDNGHYYKYVSAHLSWTDAKTAAESSMFNGVNGKLVTITTASENTFVDNLIGNHNFKLWIGLSDETTEGTYTWVTGETFDYSNWDTAQPSAGTDEDYVKFLSSNGKWNNATNNDTGITGYVIEYAPDSPPVRNPDNGHYYEYIAADNITWTDAKAAAELKRFEFEGVNGHLVTITSASENTFVGGLIPNMGLKLAWIGLTDETTEGTYKWVTGEPYSYSNWGAYQPDDNGDYVELLVSENTWFDNINNFQYTTGYIVEYDTPNT